MRAVIQRVNHAQISIEDQVTASINAGLVVFLGISSDDSPANAHNLVRKIAGLRIFTDASGKMNLSIQDVKGSLLIISNFTLYANCQKGMRPGFDRAASPDLARPLYDYFLSLIESTGIPVLTGVFQAHMRVKLENDGPVTIILDSPSSGD